MILHKFTDAKGVERQFLKPENISTVELIAAELEHEEFDLGRIPAEPETQPETPAETLAETTAETTAETLAETQEETETLVE